MTGRPHELIDRHVAAMNAKDLDAVAALFHPDAVYIDRRPLAWERLDGREAIRGFFGSVFPYMESIASEVLAESDECVVVRQQAIVSFEEQEGGGSGEVEMYLCVDVLAGLIGRAVVFADQSAALAAVGAPADDAGLRVNPGPYDLLDSWCEAVNRRDWGGVAALFTDDYSFKDTRPLGWEGAIGPDQVAELPKSFLAVSEDFVVRFEWLGGDEEWFAARIGATGAMLDGGGEFHWSVIHVAQVLGEKFRRTEVLDPDDVDGALARLAELADPAAKTEHRSADP